MSEETIAGNAAALREALAPFPSLCEWLVANAAKLGIGDMVPKLRERMDRATAALAAPARNCDMASDWLKDLYVNFKPPCRREMPPEWVDAVMKFCMWLIAPAEKGGEA